MRDNDKITELVRLSVGLLCYIQIGTIKAEKEYAFQGFMLQLAVLIKSG